MNMANTPGPPIIATVPERTPARSQAASNDAPDGFHRIDLGLDGSAAVESTLRVNTTRLRFGEFGWASNEWRPCRIRSARGGAALENCLSPSNFHSCGLTLLAFAP